MTKSILNLTGVKLLSKKQMKTVAGAGGTCSYTDGEGFIRRGISKATALSLIAMSDGAARWCCDSCGQATWLQATN
ncbi:hypothetical protein [Flavobacterium sp.]